MTLPVKEDNININIFSIFMKEILQKIWNRLIGDVTTNHNMSEIV